MMTTPVMQAMQLSEVLAAHDAARPRQSLPNALGDGVLLSKSRLCRNVRALVTLAGFRFSSTPPFPYFELPLMALESIHAHRCLPYRENLVALRDIEARLPGRLALRDLPILGMSRNPIFHESVHGLTRLLLEVTPATASTLTTEQRRLTDILFEEACANAAEALLAVASEEASFLAALAVNSFQGGAPAVRTALGRFGLPATFELMVIAYLHSNFLYKAMPGDVIWRRLARVVAPARLATLDKRAACDAFRSAFKLSPGFRLQTTSVHLRALGFPADIFELLAFEFLPELVPERRLGTVLADLSRLLERGVHAGAAVKRLLARRAPAGKARGTGRAARRSVRSQAQAAKRSPRGTRA